ncbi:hypothetical protein AN958_02887 [Leucoagaricus sp. SymC.cos]|nr:hypothetical protein AN958_02887 [Leucoagaricus sp. SymC.cos]
MVAVSSRFAFLATFCAVASVSYHPLTASAAVVEARHSDKKSASDKFPPEGDTRLVEQPVIPLPHKLSKTGMRDTVKLPKVEHGRTHKNKVKDREARSPVQQIIRLAQFPVRSSRNIYPRHHDHDDDCPDKVIVIVNGDRDHVRTRRGDVQSRSPRHARPLLQRRNDTLATGSTSDGVLGTVEVQGTDSSTGQQKSYGEFFAENRGEYYEIRVSRSNRTQFRMVDMASSTNDLKSGSVVLKTILPENSGEYCCTYDANPSSSAPMRLDIIGADIEFYGNKERRGSEQRRKWHGKYNMAANRTERHSPRRNNVRGGSDANGYGYGYRKP